MPNHIHLNLHDIKRFITKNNIASLDQVQDHDLTKVMKIACGEHHSLAMTS